MTETTETPVMVQKPNRYEEGGAVFYRASGLATCPKALVAIRDGMTPTSKPEWFQEVLDEGTRMEDVIRKQWTEEYGEIVKDDQREVKLWVMENEAGQDVYVVGHIDGITDVTDGGERVVTLWEAKKFRDSTWPKFKRSGVECNPNYPMQVSVYMHALSDEYDMDVGLFFVGGHYDDGGEAGVEGIEEIHTHGYIDPPINRLAIRKHIAGLEKIMADAAGVSDVPCCDPLQYPCGFYFLHDEKEEREYRTLTGEQYEIMEKLNAQTAEKTRVAKVLKLIDDEIKRLKGTLGMEIGTDIDTRLNGVLYHVKHVTVERDGYTVKPTSYESTTIKKAKKEDQ